MRHPIRLTWGAALLAGAVLALAPAAIPFPQSGTSQTQNPPPKPSDAKQQDAAAGDSDSVADAARKAKGEKSKPAPKKVITDEDLSSLKGEGVSVVGDEKPGAEGEPGDAEKSGAATAAKPGVKDEAYWRGRAKQLHDQIASVDAEIDKTQDEIKKGGGAGFDAQTGLSQNVIYFEDRNTKLKKLQERKAQLQKQLEDLEDEARKAGVPSGWVR